MYDMEGVQGSRHIRELFGGSVLETGKSVYRDNLNMRLFIIEGVVGV